MTKPSISFPPAHQTFCPSLSPSPPTESSAFTATDPDIDLDWLTDGRDETCNDDIARSITVTLDTPRPITWLRLQFKQSGGCSHSVFLWFGAILSYLQKSKKWVYCFPLILRIRSFPTNVFKFRSLI